MKVFGAGGRAGGFYPFGDGTGPKIFSSTTLIFKAVLDQDLTGYLAVFFCWISAIQPGQIPDIWLSIH